MIATKKAAFLNTTSTEGTVNSGDDSLSKIFYRDQKDRERQRGGCCMKKLLMKKSKHLWSNWSSMVNQKESTKADQCEDIVTITLHFSWNRKRRYLKTTSCNITVKWWAWRNDWNVIHQDSYCLSDDSLNPFTTPYTTPGYIFLQRTVERESICERMTASLIEQILPPPELKDWKAMEQDTSKGPACTFPRSRASNAPRIIFVDGEGNILIRPCVPCNHKCVWAPFWHSFCPRQKEG